MLRFCLEVLNRHSKIKLFWSKNNFLILALKWYQFWFPFCSLYKLSVCEFNAHVLTVVAPEILYQNELTHLEVGCDEFKTVESLGKL